jgi:GDP-4-dehydro-6-deoxy-D-mannose reductase
LNLAQTSAIVNNAAASRPKEQDTSVRALITGIGGFAGRHLAQHLQQTTPALELHGTVLDTPPADFLEGVQLHAVDLRDSERTRAVFAAVQPQQVYHLAGQANVGRSFQMAWETLENNARAQLNVIEAVLTVVPVPRLLLVSSGEIYGAAAPEHLPTTEDAPLRPASPYSVSKITQDMLGLQYFLSRQLPIVRARPFNHIGPGQSEGFVAPDFALQIARIESGMQKAEMYVGDLSAERDFTDVRDVVRAYCLLMERGEPGEVYNIASGQTHSVQELLDTLLAYSGAAIEVCLDPKRSRPASVPVLWGDASRLRAATGWQPTIDFRTTLLDVLNDCRQRAQLLS